MPRLAAFQILRSGSGTPLREVDRVAEQRGLDKRDRALLRKLIGTDVRRRATLRALVATFTSKKPNPDVAAHLRLGMCQIFFFERVPDHAVVSETVHATNVTLGIPKGRMVNRVLRDALRARREGTVGDPQRDLVGVDVHFDDPVFRDPREHPLLWAEDALSMPAPLLKRWSARYGQERAFALARAALHEPDLSLVCAPNTRNALREELAAADIETVPGGHDRILRAPARAAEALFASEAFAAGKFRVQGESALRAAELLDAQPNQWVLDLCAAPGGKSTALFEAGASVIAVDRNPRRLARLLKAPRPESNARLACIASDGTSALRRTPERVTFGGVLVDVPCSNTGVLAARPGARWRFGPRSSEELCALQARLLTEAASHVRPGGRLVYSTCSLEPEENGRRIRAFLAENDAFQLEVEIEALPEAEAPGPVDGGFAARLVRRAE